MTTNFSLAKKSTSRSLEPVILYLGIVIMASAVGCGKGLEPWEVTQPVVGAITYKGKSISDAELAFFPLEPSYPETVRPKAKSGDDGKFAVWTYQKGDGIPPGDYKVTVVRHPLAVSQGTIVAKPNDLPAKYSKKDTTDLKVQIEPGKHELPTLELK